MVHGPPVRRKSSAACNGNNDIDATADLPVPPDGGWGWMVVFGSFMIHIITDGMTYSFGLFNNAFLSYFNEGQGYTAWIASIMVGVTFASGPISSSFVNRYGCRAVTIAGAILAAACIIVSVFAQNVFTLILTLGFGTGLGFGLIYLPAIVSVTAYFEAKRSLATGIAVCGSGFGTFVFAPLTQYLLTNYGWRGSLLIISGIVLNCIIFGAMFRPLEPPKLPNKSTLIDNNTTMAELVPLKGNLRPNEQYLQLPPHTEVSAITKINTGCNLSRSNSVDQALQNNHNNNTTDLKNGQMKVSSVTNSKIDINNTSTSSFSHSHLDQLTQLRASHKEISASGTMYRPDILYQGSLLNIPEYMRSRNDLSSGGINNRYGSLKQSNQLNESQDLEKCCSCSKETRDTFAEMMNFSLLTDVIFVIFTVSNFCTSIGLNMPYLYIVKQADHINVSEQLGSYLIAIIGIANTVGRIVLGYISDKPWVNRLLVYNVCLTLCGIDICLTPLCTTFAQLATVCSVFGFTIGAYVGLTSVILVDLLGLEKLTNAFGLLLLFQGVASLIGPPIGGWMYDITKSYAPAFLLAGIMILISGLVMFAIPPLQKRNSKQLQNGDHIMSTCK